MSVKDAAAAVSLYSPKFFDRIAFDFEFSEEFDEYSDACEVLANHAVRFFDEAVVDKEWIMKVIPSDRGLCHEADGYRTPDMGQTKGGILEMSWINYHDKKRSEFYSFEFFINGELSDWRKMTRGQFRAQAFAAGVQLAE